MFNHGVGYPVVPASRKYCFVTAISMTDHEKMPAAKPHNSERVMLHLNFHALQQTERRLHHLGGLLNRSTIFMNFANAACLGSGIFSHPTH